MELALIGVSHKTAPVEVRERLAFPSDKIRAALASLLEKTHAAEAMILSTCNRVEIVVAQGPDAQLVQDFICEYHQIPAESISQHLYSYKNADAIR
jgi:glutamyl-tRNA reductase